MGGLRPASPLAQVKRFPGRAASSPMVEEAVTAFPFDITGCCLSAQVLEGRDCVCDLLWASAASSMGLGHRVERGREPLQSACVELK